MKPLSEWLVRIGLMLTLVDSTAVLPSRADDNLADLVPSLVPSGFTLPGPPISHDPSVFNNNPRTAELAAGINAAIFSQLPAYPLASSSGGFTYAFNSETGLLERNTKSFGPLFAERALTLGRNKWNVGWIFTPAQYDTLDGVSMSNGDLVFNYHHTGAVLDANGVPLYAPASLPSDVIQTRLSLDVKIASTILFVNYGVIKNLDLGLALPVVRTSIDGTAVETILPFGNTATTSCPPVPLGENCHQFGPGVLTETVTKSGSKTGLGDAVLRIKYNFWKEGPGGLSLGADMRFPTGDEKNLLGTGTMATKIFFVGSTEYGSISPHLNLGYTLVSGSSSIAEDIPDEANYAVGVDFAPTHRCTLNVDFVGRIQHDAQRVESSTRLWSFVPANQTPGMPTTALLDESLPVRGDISTLDGALGARVAIYRSLLVSGSIVVPLKHAEGIQDNLRWAVALEYSF